MECRSSTSTASGRIEHPLGADIHYAHLRTRSGYHGCLDRTGSTVEDGCVERVDNEVDAQRSKGALFIHAWTACVCVSLPMIEHGVGWKSGVRRFLFVLFLLLLLNEPRDGMNWERECCAAC